MAQGHSHLQHWVLIKIFDYYMDSITLNFCNCDDELQLNSSQGQGYNIDLAELIYSFGDVPEIGTKKSLDDTYLYSLYDWHRRPHKCKIQVDKASGNWKILRDANDINGLHFPKTI